MGATLTAATLSRPRAVSGRDQIPQAEGPAGNAWVRCLAVVAENRRCLMGPKWARSRSRGRAQAQCHSERGEVSARPRYPYRNYGWTEQAARMSLKRQGRARAPAQLVQVLGCEADQIVVQWQVARAGDLHQP